MNKPAAKEPSMDEILSSIRQIIADDDEGAAPEAAAKPEAEAPASPAEAASEPEPEVVPAETEAPEPEPTAEEMVEELAAPDEDDGGALELSAAQIIEDDTPAAEAEPEPAPEVESEPEADVPEMVVPEDIGFNEAEDEVPEEEPAPAEEPVAAVAAEMPDPDLSTDMAETLLEPAADAAVKSTFAKLGNIGLGASQLTIEKMIREMLRPMLKEWLDENLPSLVETMVQKEIERLARGE